MVACAARFSVRFSTAWLRSFCTFCVKALTKRIAPSGLVFAASVKTDSRVLIGTWVSTFAIASLARVFSHAFPRSNTGVSTSVIFLSQTRCTSARWAFTRSS